MNKKFTRVVALVTVAVLGMCGCGQKDSPKTPSATPKAVSGSSVVAEQPTELPAMTPVPKDMVSGTKKAYKKYFEPEKGFDLEQDGVAYGERIYFEYDSKTTGKKRSCNAVLPPNYDKNKKYPVLYILHGIGGNEGEWFSGSPIEITGNLMAKGEIEPFIIISPNIRARANDQDISDMMSADNIAAFNNFINDLKNDLMPYIKANYSISERREDTAICGLSMGGLEALSIGFQLLDTFGYIGAFSAAPSLDTSLLTLKGSEYTPRVVMIATGDSDGTVKDAPKSYHKVLTKNKVPHVWYQIPGGDHNFFAWSECLYNFEKMIFK